MTNLVSMWFANDFLKFPAEITAAMIPMFAYLPKKKFWGAGLAAAAAVTVTASLILRPVNNDVLKMLCYILEFVLMLALASLVVKTDIYNILYRGLAAYAM